MPRSSKNTENTPTRAPKLQPKRTTKRATEVKADDTPKRPPTLRTKRAPRRTPIVAPVALPETYRIFVHPIEDFETHHTSSPHYYGNGGKYIYEDHTEAGAKAWLKNNGLYGHYAFVERNNGKIGQAWHVEIEPPEEEPGFDDDLSDDDLATLDEDIDAIGESGQTLSQTEIKLRIELAKVKAKLESHTNGGAQSSLLETVRALQMLDELRGKSEPKQADSEADFFARLEATQKFLASLNPKTAPPAQPAPSPLTFEQQMTKVFENQSFIEAFIKKAIGGKNEGEKSTTELMFEHGPELLQAAGQHFISPIVEAIREGRQRGAHKAHGSFQRRQQAVSNNPDEEQMKPDNAGADRNAAPQDQALAQATIEEQIIIILLTQCKQHIPPQVTHDRLVEIAEELPPTQSIWPYFDLFAQTTPEAARDMVKMQLSEVVKQIVPDAEKVLDAPHTLKWIADLQQIIKEHEEDEEA